MRLEILVSSVEPDQGIIVDENQRQWHMVEVRHNESREPYWQIETTVKEKIVGGRFDDVVITISNETEIRRYLNGGV